MDYVNEYDEEPLFDPEDCEADLYDVNGDEGMQSVAQLTLSELWY